MVKLRLKRYGAKRHAVYRIVAIDSQFRREGKAIQEIGFYDPQKEQTRLDIRAIQFFLERGAKTTETVCDILKRAKLFDQANT